jgi:hypothetical protein
MDESKSTYNFKGPKRRWEDNIRMYLKQIGVDMRNWVDSAQRLLESPCECGIEHPGSISHGVSLNCRFQKLYLLMWHFWEP